MMPPKVGGGALGFTVLMQGDHSRHPSGIFDDIGMVTHKHRTPLDHHRHVLGQNKVAPVRHHGIKAPGGTGSVSCNLAFVRHVYAAF